jgi:5,10-methylenetetrahydromethanopterin reductase
MTKLGIGLPGLSVAEIGASAQIVAEYNFHSFSVYGDLGDLPPYAVLHATANILRGSGINRIGPMGVPVGMQHPEVIAMHAHALEEQLPGQSYVGLVRGAFLESISEKSASLAQLETAVNTIRDKNENVPLYIGGFGKRLLSLAGRLGVEGVKLGGTTNVDLAKQARETISNPDLEVVLGAVSVIDKDRKSARDLARREVAKYLDVVGPLDNTLNPDELESFSCFVTLFRSGDPDASDAISDSLLDKFALAGTPEDANAMIEKMDGVVDRFEFGTPHGLGSRANAIRFIGKSLVGKRRDTL